MLNSLKLLKQLKVFLLTAINSFIFFRFNSIRKDSIIHIYDIDNTLVDTWKYINSNDKHILRQLEFHPEMKNLINNLYFNNTVLFFSVRPLNKWNDTRFWLSSNLFKFKWFHLFLFSSPKHKVDFVLKLSNLGFKIVFTDDLSYNHENDDVKFYTEEITRVNNSSVSYVSYKDINKITKKYI
jgi:hypothetical protein